MGRIFRFGRWALLVPWLLTMDDGCAAIEAMRNASMATAKMSRAVAFAAVPTVRDARP